MSDIRFHSKARCLALVVPASRFRIYRPEDGGQSVAVWKHFNTTASSEVRSAEVLHFNEVCGGIYLPTFAACRVVGGGTGGRRQNKCGRKVRDSHLFSDSFTVIIIEDLLCAFI